MQNNIRVTKWTTCKDGPWYPGLPHGGYVAYRIFKVFDGLSWSQRHEWEHADGTRDLEDWVPSTAGWPTNMTEIEREGAAA